MSITGTAAQGQHPCWDVGESYCLTDCFHFDPCDMRVTCAVPWLRMTSEGAAAPWFSCLRPDQMVPGPDFNRIISYDPVKKRAMSSGWKKIGNEGSDLHSHVHELR